MSTIPHVELVPCLVLDQGRLEDVSGQPLADVLATLLERDAAFLRRYPSGAKFYRPRWWTTAKRPDEDVSLGYERYDVALDGTLGNRVTNWDSSG